jgi:hypothetical protein
MLELALRAKVPMLAVTSTDTLNAGAVLQALAQSSKKVTFKADLTVKAVENTNFTYILTGPITDQADTLEEVYRAAEAEDKCVIFLNAEVESTLLLDCGEIMVPRAMVQAYLSSLGILSDQDLADVLLLLGGVTLKEVDDICRLTMARDQSLSPRGVSETRRHLVGGTRGLMQIDTTSSFYDAPVFLADYVDGNAAFMLGEDDRLRPKGLMFTGIPGTGKTEGAKYIAQKWGIPLYHLDIGMMMGKWVGQSEENLRTALARVDREEPCVILLDEVEKVFTQGDDSGVATRMMSQLLWWLQEHSSRVFVVMTCNNKDAIPDELYRPGRIDDTFWFGGMTTFANGISPSIETFLFGVLEAWDYGYMLDHEYDESIQEYIEQRMNDTNNLKTVPQAYLVQWAKEWVKKYI